MNMQIVTGLTKGRLSEILSGIGQRRIGFIGDVCVDVYWYADMTKSELSRETPHYPLPVVDERISLGGGGNVLANIMALEPKSLTPVAVVGDDWRGVLIRREMERLGVDTRYVIETCGMSYAYCKPMRRGISDVVYEDPRIDFTMRPITADVERVILEHLDKAAKDVDILCVSEQFDGGVVTPAVRERICELGKQGLCVIVDSRDNIALYHDVCIKPNHIEAGRAFCAIQEEVDALFESIGGRADGPSAIYYTENDLIDSVSQVACALRKKTGRDVFVTMGAKGSMCADDTGVTHVTARDIQGPVDFVGAGDTSIAALCCTYGVASAAEAAHIAGLASEVTIQKIGTTGTASRQEILAWAQS